MTVSKIDPKFVSELVSGICHDFGAPTRHVLQFSQLLSKELGSSDIDEKQKRWLGFLIDSGSQIGAMLSSLAKLNTLTSVMNESSIDQIDLKELFNNAFSYCESIHTHDSGIELTVSGDWPVIEGVSEHWIVLFRSIISNAMIFNPKDSSHIIKIHTNLVTVDGHISFMIEDNGIGVTADQREVICRPFKRFHPPDAYPGIGMGLTYCAYIAELNDARLSFEESSLGGLRVNYCYQYIASAG